jgi:hypothetical protein
MVIASEHGCLTNVHYLRLRGTTALQFLGLEKRGFDETELTVSLSSTNFDDYEFMRHSAPRRIHAWLTPNEAVRCTLWRVGSSLALYRERLRS